MILAFFPLSVFVGGFLGFLFKKSFPALLLCLFSLINFFPVARLWASDFGEAHFLFPKLLIRFLQFSDFKLIFSAFFLAIVLLLSYSLLKQRQPFLFKQLALVFFVGMTMLIPFNPLRNEFVKKLGQDISNLSNNQPAVLYLKVDPAHYRFTFVTPFYLPPGSFVKSLKNNFPIISANTQPKRASFCFIEKSYLEASAKNATIRAYPEGSLVDCQFKN